MLPTINNGYMHNHHIRYSTIKPHYFHQPWYWSFEGVNLVRWSYRYWNLGLDLLKFGHLFLNLTLYGNLSLGYVHCSSQVQRKTLRLYPPHIHTASHLSLLLIQELYEDFNRNITFSFTFQIEYQMYFEPYVIMVKDKAPRYHEAFVGYLCDKKSYFMELYSAG